MPCGLENLNMYIDKLRLEMFSASFVLHSVGDIHLFTSTHKYHSLAYSK